MIDLSMDVIRRAVAGDEFRIRAIDSRGTSSSINVQIHAAVEETDAENAQDSE